MFQGNRSELILLLCSVTGWGQCADSTVSGKTWWEMMQRGSSYACHTAVLTAARDLSSAFSWPPGSTLCYIFDVCSQIFRIPEINTKCQLIKGRVVHFCLGFLIVGSFPYHCSKFFSSNILVYMRATQILGNKTIISLSFSTYWKLRVVRFVLFPASMT